MPFYSSKEIDSLRASMRRSSKMLQPHRDFRRELIKEFVGHEYNENGASRETMFNVWGMAVEILATSVSGGTPQVDLYTDRDDLMAFAADFSAVLNKELQRMDFGSVTEEWVLEALFGLGVLKIGTEESHYLDVLPGMQTRRSKRIFADSVDLDSWVHDMEAKDWDEIDFCGDKYRCAYEQVKKNPDYNPKARAVIQPDSEGQVNSIPDGDDDGNLTPDVGLYGETLFKEYVTLWDVYIPRDNVIVTFADGQDNVPPLLVQEWNGPRNYSGPYYILPAMKVPGNLMPKTPGHQLKPLHDLINRLWRKLSKQAGNQKTVVLVETGSQDDGRKIADSNDTQVVSVASLAGIQEVNFLGPDQGNIAFAAQAYDTFNRVAGNLEAIGGLGPQSSTVGQDAIISETASRRVAKLQQRVLAAVAQACTDIGWYLWQSEQTLTARRQMPGVEGKQYPVKIEPHDRRGDFTDYDVRISPHTLKYVAPGDRSNTLLTLLTQIIMPALPFIQQSGTTIDWGRLIQLLAKQQDLPELLNVIKTQAPNPYQQGSGDSPGKAPVTKRTYERVSRPAASREGNTQTLMQMAAGAQSSQVSALSRPTGT